MTVQLDPTPIGERLCREQHICAKPFIWDGEWLVFSDQRIFFGDAEPECFAVQFRRRPARARYITEPGGKVRLGPVACVDTEVAAE